MGQSKHLPGDHYHQPGVQFDILEKAESVMNTTGVTGYPCSAANPAWEYRDFVYQKWRTNQVWICVDGSNPYAARVARSLLWETVQSDVIPELDRWRHEGWEPTEEVGPSALHLHTIQTKDSCVDSADIALWLLTAGLALVIRLLVGYSPRVYSEFRPDEFRIQVRRPNPNVREAYSGIVSANCNVDRSQDIRVNG